MGTPTALLGILLGSAWAHDRGRLLLTILAVALGVALATLIHLVNHSATAEFEAAVRAVTGDADLRVAGPRSGFDEDIYPAIARHPEVAVASPMLDLDTKLADLSGNLRIIGVDPFRALELQPGLLGEASGRVLDLLRPGTVILSEAAASQLRLESGDRLRLRVGMREVTLEVIGVAPGADLRQPLGIMDIAAAQWALDHIGRLSRIELRLRSGVAAPAAMARIGADLPAGVVVMTAAQASRQGSSLSRAYRVNMNMLALVSLFTGAVLVFTTQTLSTLRRRVQFGLLRALGVSARALAGLVVVEAALLGAAGTSIGLLLGVAGAELAVRYAGADLGAGFYAGVIARMTLDVPALAVLAVTGIGASVLGGWLPAREAARRDPAAALKAGDEQDALQSVPSLRRALGCLALGSVLALLPPVDGLPVFGYAAIAALLIGALVAMPAYLRAILAILPLPRAPLAWLGVQRLRGAPGHAGISLAALLASFSLVTAMLVTIHSFRQSLDDWLGAVLPADLYARASGAASGWIDPADQQRLAAATGVARVVFARTDTMLLRADRPPVALIAHDMVAGEPPESLPLVARQPAPADGRTPVWISEAVHDLHGIDMGDEVRLPVSGGATLTGLVVGVWRDYARQGGAIVVPRADYVQRSGDRLANEAWIWLAPATDPGAATHALRSTLGHGVELEIREPGRLRQLSMAAFDRTFAVTYALQGAALIIGLFGISAGASAQAIARRREFGVLHHLGVPLGGLRATVAVEGGVVGLLGAGAGTAVGVAMSLVLIHVVNRQSFHWSMDLHLPWATLGALSALLVACAALTAAASVRTALGADVAAAVKEDW